MRTIIAGSRDFTDFAYFKGYMTTLPPWVEITEVVSGGAKGPDTMAIEWATIYNKSVKVFMAEWDRLGRRAGPIRNAEMSIYADALVAFWDGQSVGTKHMINLMIDKGSWTYVIRTDIPWCKKFKTHVHNCRTYSEPILNNVTIHNPNARTA